MIGRSVWIGLLVAGVLGVAAAWGLRVPAAPRGPAEAPPDVTARATAPDFEIEMYQGQSAVGGERVRLSQLVARGQPVVLNFFAALCPPCRAEMPDFQSMYDAGASERVTLIAVDIGPFVGLGPRDEGRRLLRELGITFPAGTTHDRAVTRAYQILGMPTTVLVAADGKILRKYSGLLTRELMQRFTDQLVRGSL